MDYSIKVTFQNGRVNADPNPLPLAGKEIKAGDNVTWLVPPGSKLQVFFVKAYNLLNGPAEPCGPMGPFSSLSRYDDKIVGVVGDDVPSGSTNRRFLYNLYYNGNLLEWDNPVPGQPATLGGGIDIPMTQMGNGTTGSPLV